MVFGNSNRKFKNKEGKEMRKLLSVLLVAVLGLLVFTACNPSSSVSEDLVSVELMTGQSRALTASLDFSLEGKKWKYSAVKNENDKGLTTGTTMVDTTDTPEVLTNGKTKPLSQGYWDFTLYGYASEDTNYGTLLCQGEVKNVLITMEKKIQ